MLAFITTNPDGPLTNDSTCTIDGRTVPVPRLVERTGRDPEYRILAAINELGFEQVNLRGTFRKVDGGIVIEVRPSDG